jgi:hypothetical protein
MLYFNDTPVRSYKPYKNEQFAKKLDKMRNLIKSVHETSLKDDDKKLLIKKMKDLL